MSDSVCVGLVVVCGEVASGGVDVAGFPELPVVPDAGGEDEYALADPGPDPVGYVPAVLLDGADHVDDESMKARASFISLSDELIAQAGRNDPCPCGSGKKFKKCHGR
jgi:hypothetical protein